MKRNQAYRSALVQKKTELLASLGIKFDTLAALGRVGEEDQAQISHDEFVYLQLNSLEYQKLRLVDEALDRIETGEYGMCPRCEQPIPAKRLQALPWARYCVPCQEEVNLEEDTLLDDDTRTPDLVGAL